MSHINKNTEDGKAVKEYPDNLNPFGDDDDCSSDTGASIKAKCEYPEELNHFGDDLDLVGQVGLLLFVRPDLRRPAHLVSDIKYWINYYKVLAKASWNHSGTIRKVVSKNEAYMTTMKDMQFPGKDEKMLLSELETAQVRLYHKADVLQQNGDTYLDIVKELKMYKDDDYRNVSKLDTKYKNARAKLDKQTKTVDENKKTYHRILQLAESAATKLSLNNDSYSVKMQDKFSMTASKQLEKYKRNLQKWQIKAKLAQQVAHEYREAYIAREISRAEVILSALQSNMNIVVDGNIGHSQPIAVDGLDTLSVMSILENTCTMESITVPELQEYGACRSRTLDAFAKGDDVKQSVLINKEGTLYSEKTDGLEFID